jgi:hypothetical protein
MTRRNNRGPNRCHPAGERRKSAAICSGRDFSRTSRTAINACACDDPLSASQHYAPQCARDDGLG